MSEFNDRIAKMTADLADRTAVVEKERAAVAAQQAEKRAVAVQVLNDVAMPLVEEVRTSCDEQGIKYALDTEFEGLCDPCITFQCNGWKARSDGSTYIVDGAELLISHDGKTLSVKIRRYPRYQKGPTALLNSSDRERIINGFQAALNSYFLALTPDK